MKVGTLLLTTIRKEYLKRLKLRSEESEEYDYGLVIVLEEKSKFGTTAVFSSTKGYLTLDIHLLNNNSFTDIDIEIL